MARVFTFDIYFRNSTFKTLIILNDREEGLNVTLRVFDKETIRILGKDSITFIGLNGYKSLEEIQHAEAREFLEVVYNTLMDHLAKGKPLT